MGKTASKHKQGTQTRWEISHIAMDLFSSVGYEATTIQDICEKADVSVGAFYYYYQSKEDILYDLYKKMDEGLAAHFWNAQFDDPVRGILEVQAYLANALQARGVRIPAQIFKNELTAHVRYILNKDRVYCQLIFRLVTEAAARGQFNPIYSAQSITDAIFRLSRGVVYDWCLHDGGYDLGKQLQTDTRFVLAYSRPEA